MRSAAPPSIVALAFALGVAQAGVAQYALQRVGDLPWDFARGGETLALAGLGGLNSPQPSYADLDGDGRDELYLFDRDGDVHLGLHVLPDGSHRYDPGLTAGWPAVTSLCLLRDFDVDGVPDLFAFSSVPGQSGIEVFRGFRQNGRLSFEAVAFPAAPADVLYSRQGDLIYVAVTDVPVVSDLDGDGDLDILSVDPVGSYVRHYENVSTPPSEGGLAFDLASPCFGGVFESAFDGSVILSSAPGECAEPPGERVGPRSATLHPGSTLGLADLDGDGDPDLLVGDVAAETMVALFNEPGPGGAAHFTRAETTWPEARGAVAVDLPFFPAAYPVSPRGAIGSEVYLVSPSNPGGGADRDVLWRYGPNATGELELLERDFLASETLDRGTGAHAAFGDLDGDGIDDLLVGNDRAYNGGDPVASLAFYAYEPARAAYVAAEPPWLASLNAFIGPNVGRPTPVLHDTDADGDLDLLFGTAAGPLAYAENVAGPAAPARFSAVEAPWQGIDVGLFTAPALGDLTGDGLPDLLVGDRVGRLSFFPNVGSASEPAFAPDPTEENYAGIDVRRPGFPSPVVRPSLTEVNGAPALYIGTADGRLLVYDQLPTSGGGEARLAVDSTLDVGADLDVAFGRDPAGASLVAVGNARGGLGFFRVEGLTNVRDAAPSSQADGPALTLFPNPTRGAFYLPDAEAAAPVQVHDLLGVRVYAGPARDMPDDLAPGTYIVSLGQRFARLVVR